MPAYNMAKLYRDSRGILTGDITLNDVLNNYEPEILTSDNTIDTAEISAFVFSNFIRLQNVLPATYGQAPSQNVDDTPTLTRNWHSN